jgi:hypothetical protein
MENYDTLSSALNSLKERGYNRDFNSAFDKLICTDSKDQLNPDEFEITEVYRFEGDTNPADESVIYAVESKKGNMKGVLVSAYGTYADPMSDEMIQKLSYHRH